MDLSKGFQLQVLGYCKAHCLTPGDETGENKSGPSFIVVRGMCLYQLAMHTNGI